MATTSARLMAKQEQSCERRALGPPGTAGRRDVLARAPQEPTSTSRIQRPYPRRHFGLRPSTCPLWTRMAPERPWLLLHPALAGDYECDDRDRGLSPQQSSGVTLPAHLRVPPGPRHQNALGHGWRWPRWYLGSGDRHCTRGRLPDDSAASKSGRPGCPERGSPVLIGVSAVDAPTTAVGIRPTFFTSRCTMWPGQRRRWRGVAVCGLATRCTGALLYGPFSDPTVCPFQHCGHRCPEVLTVLAMSGGQR